MAEPNSIIWASGGLCAGCLLGVCVTRLMNFLGKRTVKESGENGEMIGIEMMNRIGKFNDQITTYSDISMLLGSPTSSGMLDSSCEYNCYPAYKGYPDLTFNRTIMSRYLTQSVYEELYNLKTSSGCEIDVCIQPGIDCPDKVSCGIVAGDEECYDLFASIFGPVISDRHRGCEAGNETIGAGMTMEELNSKPFDSDYVKSTHFLVGRCIRGFRFPPTCRRAERRHIEGLLQGSLESLEGDFTGVYHHLTDLPTEERLRLPDILQSVIDPPESRTLISSGSTRDWPCGRGIFYSQNVDFYAWTNREDHIRLMYRDRELDFVESFKKFIEGLDSVEMKLKENGLEYAKHKDYGYLLTCPSGIGTALRAGVHMKLPRLLRDQRFRSILKNFRLHMGAEDQEMLRRGYVDVYNMDRLGFNENYLVQHVADSVHLLTEMEQHLERKESISNLIVLSTNDEHIS